MLVSMPAVFFLQADNSIILQETRDGKDNNIAIFKAIFHTAGMGFYESFGIMSPAGFESQAQWSQLHTVALAPFHLTSEPAKLPLGLSPVLH